ncbi:hypothetical protein LCGC14_0479810 [marine sediment metagenome]|uniref:Uncharacterized protein n=1 Tax=marine sediment metagenome TaxID=412755 RepID=A0A0F9S9T2_9ZZZZ
MRKLWGNLLVGAVKMDIKKNDILEFKTGNVKVKILVTHVDHGISGETIEDVLGMPTGKFIHFSEFLFDKMVTDGILSKVGHHASGIHY